MVITVVLVLLAAVAIRDAYLLLFKGYVWSDWTGIGQYTGPSAENSREVQRAKTLWDLMELLIVPAVLGFGALLFNKAARDREQEIAEDQQREESLQNYLDKMAELLLKEKLLENKDYLGEPVVEVAQARTVTTLRILDRNRRTALFQFLRDANLADFILVGASLTQADLSNTNMRGINLSKVDMSRANLGKANLTGDNLGEADLWEASLRGADLSFSNLNGANLNGANLNGTDLRRSHLTEALLRDANLSRANLWEADLRGAQLYHANLGRANVRDADLRGADLTDAYLRGADLTRANLTAAKVSEEQLARAKSLEGATMPDGTVHG